MKRKVISLLVAALAIATFTMRARLDFRNPSLTPPSGWKAVSGDQLRNAQASLQGVVPNDILEAFSVASEDIVTCFYFDPGNKELSPTIILAVHPGKFKLTERPFQEVAAEFEQAALSVKSPVKIDKITDIQLANLGLNPALAASVEMSYQSSMALGFQYHVPAGRKTVTITGVCPVDSKHFATCADVVRRSAESLKLPWQVPSLVLNVLTGLAVGGLVFAWLYWSKSDTQTGASSVG